MTKTATSSGPMRTKALQKRQIWRMFGRTADANDAPVPSGVPSDTPVFGAVYEDALSPRERLKRLEAFSAA